jgi:arsenite oxidase small subunit
MMKRCQALAEVGRRQFLRGGSVAAASAAAAVVVGGEARAATVPNARVSYPTNRLANLADLKPNEPVEITYPDADSPGVLIKLGKAVATGIGPDGDVVGFSTMCPHKGFHLRYSAGDRAFDCPGHYSRFDAENAGMQIWGQATQNLAQFQLTVDEKGDIYASGVDELIYGRLSNVL